MSNRKSLESSGHRKPKVSLAMVIIQGLGGPKPMLRARTRIIMDFDVLRFMNFHEYLFVLIHERA